MNSATEFPHRSGRPLISDLRSVGLRLAVIILAIQPVAAVFEARTLVGTTVAVALLWLPSVKWRHCLDRGWIMRIAACIGAIVLWSGLSALWSAYPDRSLAQTGQTAGTFVLYALTMLGVVSAAPNGRSALGLIAVGYGVAMAILLVEPQLDFPLYKSLEAAGLVEPFSFQTEAKGYAVIAVACPILGVALWAAGWRMAAGAIVIFGGFTLSFGSMLAAEIAFWVAAVGMAAMALAPRLTVAATSVLVAVVMLLAPIGGEVVLAGVQPDTERVADSTVAASPDWTARVPFTWRHRLAIWHYSADRIVERPLLGHGTDAARWIAKTGPRPTVSLGFDNIMPLHPHNAALQVWIELGLVGALLMTALLLLTLRAIHRLGPIARVAAFGAFTAYLVIGMVSFGMWQTWWMTLPIVLGALSLLLLPQTTTNRQEQHSAA